MKKDKNGTPGKMKLLKIKRRTQQCTNLFVDLKLSLTLNKDKLLEELNVQVKGT